MDKQGGGTRAGVRPSLAGSLPGDLAIGQDIWPVMPEATRAGILAMVKAANGDALRNRPPEERSG